MDCSMRARGNLQAVSILLYCLLRVTWVYDVTIYIHFDLLSMCTTAPNSQG